MYIYMYSICIPKYMCIMYMYIWKTELTENDSFRLFAANGKGKRQAISDNRRLLFQQACPSMLICS